MRTKPRDQYRRLAIFDRDGEAISTMLLSNEAITFGYRERGITVEVRGTSQVVFTLMFDTLVMSHDRHSNQEYPQILLSVAYGNAAIIENLDFGYLAKLLNCDLPRGKTHFQLSYATDSFMRPMSSEYKKYLF